jgi:ATP-binding cassette subfamily B protein
MRERASAVRTVLELARRAAPAALAGVVGLTALGAATPVAGAWLTKVVIDRLTGQPGGSALGPALALAVVGVLTAVLPHFDGLLRGEIAREVGLLAQDR